MRILDRWLENFLKEVPPRQVKYIIIKKGSISSVHVSQPRGPLQMEQTAVTRGYVQGYPPHGCVASFVATVTFELLEGL